VILRRKSRNVTQQWLPDRHQSQLFELPLIDGEGKSLRLIAGSLYGARAPVATLSDMFYADVTLAANARLPVADDYEQRALYIIRGRIDIDGASFDVGQLVVLRPQQSITVRALAPAQLLLLGGAPMDGPRHVWWNFVSSSIERIEQAKADWRQGRLRSVSGLARPRFLRKPGRRRRTPSRGSVRRKRRPFLPATRRG